MALRDFIIIAHTPVNYTSASTKIQDQIIGIDNALGTVLPGGRPGDEGIKAPSISELTAAGLGDALAYWTLNFDDASQIPSSDADYTLISNDTPANSYVPFGVVNAKSALPEPLGALLCHEGTKAFTTAELTDLALNGNMTMLCMGMHYLQNDGNTYNICNYGNKGSSSETGVNRVPFNYTLSSKSGIGSSTFRDRVLNYSHYDSGDVLVRVSPDLDAAAQSGDGMGVSIPGSIEFGHGFTRSVAGTTEVKFYVNGLKIHTESGLSNPGTSGTDPNMRLHLGVLHSTSQSFDGYLRCFGLWDRVLSDAEVDAFYQLCIGRS